MLQCKEDIFFLFRYDFKNLQKCSVFKKRNQQYQFKSLELTLIVHVYIATILRFLYALQFFFAEVFDIRSFDIVLYLINL